MHRCPPLWCDQEMVRVILMSRKTKPCNEKLVFKKVFYDGRGFRIRRVNTVLFRLFERVDLKTSFDLKDEQTFQLNFIKNSKQHGVNTMKSKTTSVMENFFKNQFFVTRFRFPTYQYHTHHLLITP